MAIKCHLPLLNLDYVERDCIKAVLPNISCLPFDLILNKLQEAGPWTVNL